MIKILKEIEQNEFYNPRYSNNGGGYSQPYYEFEINGEKGSLSDTSCGDFGDRWELTIGKKQAYYDGVGRREFWTDFTEEDAELAEEIHDFFGIWIIYPKKQRTKRK